MMGYFNCGGCDMWTGRIIKISGDGEVFAVEFPATARVKRYSVFMLAQPGNQVALEVGGLVAGQLDAMRCQELVRKVDGHAFKAIGQHCTDSYEGAVQLVV